MYKLNFYYVVYFIIYFSKSIRLYTRNLNHDVLKTYC